MDWVSIIIALVSGLIGGNIAGGVQQDKGLGIPGNSVAGAVGGGISNYILQLLGLFGVAGASTAAGAPVATPDIANLDIGQIIGNIAGSGIGGAILTLICTFIKSSMNK